MMTGTGEDWEKHQHREIDRYLRQCTGLGGTVQTCIPAYPGSMLFNQIAVLSASDLSYAGNSEVPRFESLDPVYESLSYTGSRFLPDNSILLDCQVWRPEIEELLVVEFDKLAGTCTELSTVVILSDPHRARLERICRRLSLNHVVIRPSWRKAAALLHLYRCVDHAVFVDTARSLDAAMIGVECSMIVSDEYSQSPVSSLLFYALSQLPYCRLRHQATTAVASATAAPLMVENSSAALQAALGLGSTDVDAEPVIRAGAFWQQRWKNKLGNLRVSTRRKARKLTEDPHAFFADSKLPGCKAIASAWPARAQTKRLSVRASEKESVADVDKRAA